MDKKIAVRCECGSDAPSVDELLAHVSGITGLTREFFDRVFAKRITQKEYDGHDCHAGPESACAVCVAWHEQKDEERRAVDEAMLKVQLGNF